MRVLCCVTLLLLASSVGCLSEDDVSPGPAGSGSVMPAETPAPAEDLTSDEGSATREEGSATREEGSATKASEPIGAPDTEPGTATDTKPAAKPKTERVKADVGVGKKGRSLDDYDKGVEGVIASPAKAYFTVREKAIFQIQIPQAMQLYKAANGTNPKSHDEFMSKIIEANSIQLPELRTGHKYVYDPEKGELMVERPQ